MDTLPPYRYVTASLRVDYLKPTPLGVPLEVRARVKEIKGRKVVMDAWLSAQGQVCARGEVVAIQVATAELAGGEWTEGPKVSQISEEQRMRSMGAPELPGLSTRPFKNQKR